MLVVTVPVASYPYCAPEVSAHILKLSFLGGIPNCWWFSYIADINYCLKTNSTSGVTLLWVIDNFTFMSLILHHIKKVFQIKFDFTKRYISNHKWWLFVSLSFICFIKQTWAEDQDMVWSVISCMKWSALRLKLVAEIKTFLWISGIKIGI